MKVLSAFTLALVLATGAAMAQGSGSGGGGGGGGTEPGPSGMNTGKDAAGMNPTPEQCAKGWDATMRVTQAEFNAKCKKQ